MTTDEIINQCLKDLGEEDPANPVEMTREDCLLHIDMFYRNDIGKRLRLLTVHSYDGSDAAHTITAGIGPLPADFLAPSRVYDGDTLLKQIFDIDDKVPDTSPTSQYMLPDISNIWIFGTTPTGTVKLYYYRKPAALTDSSSSSPSELKEEFHVKPFMRLIKGIYDSRNHDNDDVIDMEAYCQDYLNAIENAHRYELMDDGPQTVEVVRLDGI